MQILERFIMKWAKRCDNLLLRKLGVKNNEQCEREHVFESLITNSEEKWLYMNVSEYEVIEECMIDYKNNLNKDDYIFKGYYIRENNVNGDKYFRAEWEHMLRRDIIVKEYCTNGFLVEKLFSSSGNKVNIIQRGNGTEEGQNSNLPQKPSSKTKKSDEKTTVTLPLLEYDKVNKNNTVYPKDCFNPFLKDPTGTSIKNTKGLPVYNESGEFSEELVKVLSEVMKTPGNRKASISEDGIKFEPMYQVEYITENDIKPKPSEEETPIAIYVRDLKIKIEQSRTRIESLEKKNSHLYEIIQQQAQSIEEKDRWIEKLENLAGI